MPFPVAIVYPVNVGIVILTAFSQLKQNKIAYLKLQVYTSMKSK